MPFDLSRTQTEAARAHLEIVERGEHIFTMLNMREVPPTAGDHAIEIDVTPQLANIRGALQGGLIATLVDIVAGSYSYMLVADDDATTATTNLNIHYLAPVVIGPARAEAHMVRKGRTTLVLQVDVTDVGRDRLAAIATISFQILPNRPDAVTSMTPLEGG